MATRDYDMQAAAKAAAADSVTVSAANGACLDSSSTAAAAASLPNGDSAAGPQPWLGSWAGRTVAAALRPASAAAAAATHAARTAAAAAESVGVGRLLLCSAAGAAAGAGLSTRLRHHAVFDNTPAVLKELGVCRLTPEEMDVASRHGWTVDGE